MVSGDRWRAEVEPNDSRSEAQPLGGPAPRVIEGYAAGADEGLNGSVFVEDNDGGNRQSHECVAGPKRQAVDDEAASRANSTSFQ